MIKLIDCVKIGILSGIFTLLVYIFQAIRELEIVIHIVE